MKWLILCRISNNVLLDQLFDYYLETLWILALLVETPQLKRSVNANTVLPQKCPKRGRS
ncbi:MAG: hypothetical protein VX432_00465 [Candidatus Poribacteria bacterium]|nr:hypothetical protein [Candidatus Poribacteria bacterium]